MYPPGMTYPAWQSYVQNPPWLDHSRGGYENDVDSPSPLTRWIEEFQFPDSLKVLPHVGYYDGKGDTDNFIHVFKGELWMEKHGYTVSSLMDTAYWSSEYVQVYARQVGRVLLDGGAAYDIIYKHYFLKLRKEVAERGKDIYTTLSGFSGEHVSPLGEISLRIAMGESPHHRSEQITFVIVRSDSPQNMLFETTVITELGMIPSTMHSTVFYQSEIGPELSCQSTKT
ncbi:hypothetical protein Tco_1274943 [Tanacetum coccineum]